MTAVALVAALLVWSVLFVDLLRKRGEHRHGGVPADRPALRPGRRRSPPRRPRRSPRARRDDAGDRARPPLPRLRHRRRRPRARGDAARRAARPRAVSEHAPRADPLRRRQRAQRPQRMRGRDGDSVGHSAARGRGGAVGGPGQRRARGRDGPRRARTRRVHGLARRRVARATRRRHRRRPGPAPRGAEPVRPLAGHRARPSRRTIRLPAGVRIDLGGSAKGLAADLAAELLGRRATYAVDVGGDIRIGGTHPIPRTVHIRHPLDGEIAHSFAVTSGAVATSGLQTRLWRTERGFAHHLIDPGRGTPAWTGVIQATALAPTGLEAETLAKTALLRGPLAGRDLLARQGGALVLDDGSLVLAGGLAATRRGLPHDRDRRGPADLLAGQPRARDRRDRPALGLGVARTRDVRPTATPAWAARPAQAIPRGLDARDARADRRPRRRAAARRLPATQPRRGHAPVRARLPALLDRPRRHRRLARADPRGQLLRPPLDRPQDLALAAPLDARRLHPRARPRHRRRDRRTLAVDARPADRARRAEHLRARLPDAPRPAEARSPKARPRDGTRRPGRSALWSSTES